MSAAPARAAHAVSLQQAAVRAENARVGTRFLPVAGVQLSPGGHVRARLKTALPGVDPAASHGVSVMVTLATAPRDYGKRQIYRVRADGQEVYRAAEIDPGAGVTRSFFIDVPMPRASTEVEIAADPTTEASITVASLRCYTGQSSDYSKSKIQNPKSKMGLALLSPQGNGYALDAATMQDLFHKLPHSPYLTGQLAVLYNFCSRNAAENAAEIERLAGLAEATGLPLRIAFQMHWGGIPRGVSDGAGGTFTDLPYQQITFDPDNHVEDAGLKALMGDRYDVRYGLTVPNVWGDTPWLTFNHPRLNQLRRVRLTQALIAWREARERLVRQGKGRLLPPELSTGEETVYWARGVEDRKYTTLNGGKPRAHLMADFNPFVVADALRDHVVLDPRDGLDDTERRWLHLNMARQQQRIVDWMFDALPADPVRLGEGPAGFADDLPRRNLFTEPYAMPLFPMKEVSLYHPGLEVGYVQDGRSGGEYWSGATMLPWLLKERECGRIALPNLECTGANDAQLVACLQAAYACGARFATLYNWQPRPTTPKLLRAFADSIETPAGIAFPSVSIGYGSKWERTYRAGPGAFGVNCIELFRQDGGAAPLPVRVSLSDIDPSRGNIVRVTTLLTPSPLHPFTPSVLLTPSSVCLPTVFPQEPGRAYLLTVEALGPPGGSAQTGPAALGLATDGKVAVRLTADIRLERARSQAIAAWQDAADLLDSLRAYHAHTAQSLFAHEALEAAQAALAANQPDEAYRAGIRAEQLSLPAAFTLPAPGGRLAPYWITILCPGGPIRATITTYSPRAAVVSIKSAVAQHVTVRWGRLETVATLTPNVAAEIGLDQGKR